MLLHALQADHLIADYAAANDLIAVNNKGETTGYNRNTFAVHETTSGSNASLKTATRWLV